MKSWCQQNQFNRIPVVFLLLTVLSSMFLVVCSLRDLVAARSGALIFMFCPVCSVLVVLD